MSIPKVYCLDASILVRFLISGEAGTPIAQLWESWLEAGSNLVAPTLLFYELGNALHQYYRHHHLTIEELNHVYQLAHELNITLLMDADLHKRAIQLAQIHQLPAVYDAHYLAVAERMGAEFWTLDKKLVNAVNDKLPWVIHWGGKRP